MVDYTTKQGGGFGIAIYLAAGLVVLVILYALFAGGGTTTQIDPATAGTAEPAIVEETAPAAPAEPVISE